MTFALLPAAGASRRMGRPKLSLPLGDTTVLGQVVRTLRQAGIEHVIVVANVATAPEVSLIAEASGAEVCRLYADTPDMRATVEEGLRWLETRFHPQPDDDWLLVPADHPALDAVVVRQLCVARATHPNCSVVVPTFEGRRGHPTLISWKHVEGIRAHPAGQGLNRYLRLHQGETLELPVTSADVLCDLDTPEDYERLRRRWGGL